MSIGRIEFNRDLQKRRMASTINSLQNVTKAKVKLLGKKFVRKYKATARVSAYRSGKLAIPNKTFT